AGLLLGREIRRADHEGQLTLAPAGAPPHAPVPATAERALRERRAAARGGQQGAHQERGSDARHPHGSAPVSVLSTSRAIASRLCGLSSAAEAEPGSPLREKRDAETSDRIAATSCGCMLGGTGVTARHTATSTHTSSTAAAAERPTAAGSQRRGARTGAERVTGSGV